MDEDHIACSSGIADLLQHIKSAEMETMPASQLSSQTVTQAIEKKESLETVQMLLHGSVGKGFLLTIDRANKL